MKLNEGETIATTRSIGVYEFHFIFHPDYYRLAIGIGQQQLWASENADNGSANKMIYDGLRFLLNHLENHLALTKDRIAQTLLVRPVT